MNERQSGDSSPGPCPPQLLCSFVHKQCSGFCAAHFLHCQLKSCDGPSSFGKASSQSHRRLALPWSLALAVILLECRLRSALRRPGQASWGPKEGGREWAGRQQVTVALGSRQVAYQHLIRPPRALSSPPAPYQVHQRLHSGAHLPPLVRERISPALNLGHSPPCKERPRDRKGDLPSGRPRTKNLGSRFPAQGHFL